MHRRKQTGSVLYFQKVLYVKGYMRMAEKT